MINKHDRLWERTSLEIVRQWAHSINWHARLMAIRGPRGVGKTTMMRQYIKQHYAYMDRQVLYVSCDDAYFSTRSLLDLAEQFYLIGGKHLFIDEIHKYENWRKNSLSRLCISFLLCTFAAVNCYGKRTGMSNEVFMHDYFNDDELELLW